MVGVCGEYMFNTLYRLLPEANRRIIFPTNTKDDRALAVDVDIPTTLTHVPQELETLIWERKKSGDKSRNSHLG